ncbi:hypothetical protein LPJ53_000674 [Coemansia erecta]|uniref:Autophagy-related protein 14 n=1 Tax=Coemansia erecta TaxID=147472 RepID=A0A9W8CUW4_9FUNG|nr:hypothetical protein LPJ53_000674 [Coemansia erecta]
MQCEVCKTGRKAKFFCGLCIQDRVTQHDWVVGQLAMRHSKLAAVDSSTQVGVMQQLYEYQSSRLEQRRQRVARLRAAIAERQQQITAAQNMLQSSVSGLQRRKAQQTELAQESHGLHRQERGALEQQEQGRAAFRRLAQSLRKDRATLASALSSVVGLRLGAPAGDTYAQLADGDGLFGLAWPSGGEEGHGSWGKYPREYIDACVGHCAHVLSVLAHYYHVGLPFRIVRRGARLVIRQQWEAQGEAPLSAGEERPRFVVGLAMLFYDVLFLCWSRGVRVGADQATEAVANLRRAAMGTGEKPRGMFEVEVYDVVVRVLALYSGAADEELRQQVHLVLRSLHLCDDAVDSVDNDDDNWAII